MHLDKCTSIRSNQQQHTHAHTQHTLKYNMNHRYNTTSIYSDKWYALTPIALFIVLTFAWWFGFPLETTIFQHNQHQCCRCRYHTAWYSIFTLLKEKGKKPISCKWTHLWSSMENKYVSGAFHSIPIQFVVLLCACERLKKKVWMRSLTKIYRYTQRDSYIQINWKQHCCRGFFFSSPLSFQPHCGKEFYSTLGNTFHMKFEKFTPQRCVHQKWLTNSNCVRSWHLPEIVYYSLHYKPTLLLYCNVYLYFVCKTTMFRNSMDKYCIVSCSVWICFA